MKVPGLKKTVINKHAGSSASEHNSKMTGATVLDLSYFPLWWFKFTL